MPQQDIRTRSEEILAHLHAHPPLRERILTILDPAEGVRMAAYARPDEQEFLDRFIRHHSDAIATREIDMGHFHTLDDATLVKAFERQKAMHRLEYGYGAPQGQAH